MQGAESGFGGRERAMGNESELAIQVQALKTRLDTVLPTLATREQLAQEVGALRSEMKQEIGDLRSEMKQEIGDLRSEMKQEIGGLRAEMGGLRAEIHQTFASAIKWGLGMSCSAILAAVALVTLPQHFQSSVRQREAKAMDLRRGAEAPTSQVLTAPSRLPAATRGQE